MKKKCSNNNYLPIEGVRDLVNLIRQDIKYKLTPGRLYYKYRAYKYKKYKTPELEIIELLCSDKLHSLDIGANLGLFTYYISKNSRQVFAFEPNPINLRYLNHLVDENVKVFPFAVGDVDQEIDLLIPKSKKGWSTNGASILDKSVKNGIKIQVACKRVDDFCSGIDIGFMKIDVEGAEIEVIRGSLDTLRRCRPNMIIENEIVHNDKPDHLFNEIYNLNYEIFYYQNKKLNLLSKDLQILDIQKEPENKRIGYLQNFICIHKDNINNYKDMISK